MGQPINVEQHQPTDSLTRLILFTLGLTVLGAIVFVCLPKNSIIKTGNGMAKAGKNAKQWTQTELAKGRHFVSYNNPAVRSTLDLPWAKKM